MTYSQYNIEQLFRLIGSFPQQQYGRSTYYEFIKTKDSAWPNQLLNLNTSEQEIDFVLNLIENNAKSGVVPDLFMLHPNYDDDSITEQIRKRGYKSGEWTAMTHSLKRIDAEKKIPGFHVKLVLSSHVFKEWLTIVETELMGNNALNEDVFKMLLNHPGCYFYLGFSGNKPVATSFLFVQEKSAGVYLVSTKDLYRKQGIGQEMTRHCLLKAKELSCEQADLQATKLGAGVYESLGFAKCGVINVFRIQKRAT